ncbi:uncharacterized protein LOC108901720 [Lates calcarifer]|uniref:Uncharacterized protein LOC108901720 n=1 Tax=Lates calcarifer TaxID=8187 RepID=A0AAJ7VKT1_LATCA|nr:uncharacterized protein LOC108901720 [Lates calcarifer]
MSASLLLLLLLGGSQASHYYGTVMTFTPKETRDDGSIRVVFHYKLNFRSCTDSDSWDCVSGDCGTESVVVNIVDKEDGRWCQLEGLMTRQVSTDAPFQLRLDGGDWISVKNGVSNWRAVTKVDLRVRSDTGRPNRSPQTTILPALQVPSNCQRDFSLLAFDPDGDEVVCRYGDTAAGECNPCSPPSVLTISPRCTLSFHPTSSSNEGSYAVQVEMEDFSNQSVSRVPSDAFSKIPIRFALMVDPAVPSCTEGLYLPKFLPPTPVNGAQVFAYINHTLEITVKAEAANSQVSELLFSGPHNVVHQTGSGGQFNLSWTPSEDQDGENHPICFAVQAANEPTKYYSELRCVIVSVSSEPPTTVLPATTPQTTTPVPFIPVNETEVYSNRSEVLEESTGPDEDSSGVGKVVGIVFGVGAVIAIAAVGIWAVRGSLL